MPASNSAEQGRSCSRACAIGSCGRVGAGVRVFEVSDVLSVRRIALCARDVARFRRDPLLLVAAVDEEDDE